jgi:membrane protein required for colicin V production
MAGFDIAVLVILLISFALGAWRGFIREIFSLIAWFGAVFAAVFFSGQLSPFLQGIITNPVGLSIASFIATFFLVFIVLSLIGWGISKFISVVGLGFIDRGLGLLFGLVRGGLICLLLVILGGLTTFPKAAWWQDAISAPPLEVIALSLRPFLPDAIANRMHYRNQQTSLKVSQPCVA